MKTFIFFFALLYYSNSLLAQQSIFSKADALIAKNDNTGYVNELYNISQQLNASNNHEAILKVNRKLLEYYKNYDFKKDSILKYYNKGLELSKTYDNLEYKTNFTFMWADYLVSKGEYPEALAIFQSLENTIERHNYDFLPHFYDAYARLFYYLKKYDQAFYYLKKEAKIFEERNALTNISATYNNLGILYKAQKQIDSSLFYHHKANDINLQLKDTINIIKSYNNIGQVYFLNDAYAKAEQNYLKAYNYAPEKATNSLLNNYAAVLLFQGENKKAEEFLLKVKGETKNKELLKSTLNQLIAIKKQENDFEKALAYQEELNEVSAALLDDVKIKEIERLQIAYETAKKENEIKVLKEKNDIQRDIIQKNRLLVIIMLFVLVLSIVIFVLYLRNQENVSKLKTLRTQQRVLRSLMNPHFIFNALSNIQTNILKQENEKAVQYLVKFSKLLRYNLEQNNLNSALFSEEFQSIIDYLDMQKLRLDGKLHYHMHIDDTIEEDSIKVPAMLLQPIIENAIEHGIGDKDSLTIDIHIIDRTSYLKCVITDDGVGFSNTIQLKNTNKKSYATTIIKERLKLLSKKTKLPLEYTINDLVEEDIIIGTKATITLPILNDSL